jgi:tripartite-type tricarboxylate transporter receptor subunit TctC
MSLSRRQALARMLAACGIPMLGFPPGRPISGRQTPCEGIEGKRIRWLVGYSPGGGYDAYSRLLEPVLERVLGANILVDNVPGAAGIVAARTLANATADGRTLGIIDGPGLLLANRRRLASAPDLETDLVALGRVARLHPVLVTATRSGLTTIEDLLARARSGPLVAGVTATASQNFVNCALTAHLFGIDVRFVVGFPGSRELVLALVRGDVDFMAADAESVRGDIESDKLIPILRIARQPLGLYAALDGVPILAGEEGITARRPELFKLAGPGSSETAESLVRFTSVGRLVVGPVGLPAQLRLCLEQGLSAALADPEFRTSAARAHRSLAVASGAEVRRELAMAASAITRLLPVVERAARETS